MGNKPEVIAPEKLRGIRLYNIIDMGLTFSAMIRLFKKDTKGKLRKRVLDTVKRMFDAKSEEEFRGIHAQFCQWGAKEIFLAKKGHAASYGQVAKTLDVVLKVVVYYCHLPDCDKSKQLTLWLNAAVDTRMMNLLKQHYAKDIDPWPSAIERVNEPNYIKIQEIVRKFNTDKHQASIVPVQFDDYYWYTLNRRLRRIAG